MEFGSADVAAFVLFPVAAGRATAEFGGGFPVEIVGFAVVAVRGGAGVAGGNEFVDGGAFVGGAGCAAALGLAAVGFAGPAGLFSALAAASGGVSVITIDSTASRRIIA